ncbi:hypothetical protein PV405_30005 [Streptomyces sp. ME02-6979-3A]|uniref:hypothetical protein n=1 Tax=Streptomyces sp. ME02-6979-3A TaxID=3028673 RepID=UPI0029A221B8|nr:hypothetical protein [Streptomyces sp. ME02-6979-3A]MDX3328847.1 hypothetical protein [Streptomyces sp. ME02-6979-3A]
MSIIPSAAPNDTSPTVPGEDSYEAAVARYLATPYTDDVTPAPMTPEREAEIRADLAAVPAPPWRWIGSRHAGGPELVTDHSGRQYLLRAAKPTDHRGDELLDPETDAVVYGDLEFRDQREGETYSWMRPGNSLAVGRTEYDPDAIVGVANPIARWFEKSAQHTTDLLAEVDRLRAELAFRRRQFTPVEALAYDMDQALADLPPAERRGADAVLQVLRARAAEATIPFTTEATS